MAAADIIVKTHFRLVIVMESNIVIICKSTRNQGHKLTNIIFHKWAQLGTEMKFIQLY